MTVNSSDKKKIRKKKRQEISNLTISPVVQKNKRKHKRNKQESSVEKNVRVGVRVRRKESIPSESLYVHIYHTSVVRIVRWRRKQR